VIQEIAKLLEDNIRNKEAGRAMLQQLPWWLRSASRLKSCAMLVAIYSTFWVRKGVHYGLRI
jgi:hypothetical protein